jgi:hypothetical protein
LISDSVEMKFENQDVLRTFMQVYYQEDNALMRERVQLESIRRVAPLLAQIIHQGVAEGAFVVTYPDICAEIVLQAIGNMSRTVIELFLTSDHDLPAVETVQNIINAHEETITRVLDVPVGSIKVADVDLYGRWLEA